MFCFVYFLMQTSVVALMLLSIDPWDAPPPCPLNNWRSAVNKCGREGSEGLNRGAAAGGLKLQCVGTDCKLPVRAQVALQFAIYGSFFDASTPTTDADEAEGPVQVDDLPPDIHITPAELTFSATDVWTPAAPLGGPRW